MSVVIVVATKNTSSRHRWEFISSIYIPKPTKTVFLLFLPRRWRLQALQIQPVRAKGQTAEFILSPTCPLFRGSTVLFNIALHTLQSSNHNTSWFLLQILLKLLSHMHGYIKIIFSASDILIFFRQNQISFNYSFAIFQNKLLSTIANHANSCCVRNHRIPGIYSVC